MTPAATFYALAIRRQAKYVKYQLGCESEPKADGISIDFGEADYSFFSMKLA